MDTPQDDYVGESVNRTRLLDQILKGYDKRLVPSANGKYNVLTQNMFCTSWCFGAYVQRTTVNLDM